jgi:UDP-N-acetylglucosamine--N-acetylmuramyl-(pentapeptide) pyrophosphoryl-undecaprenol N-acetylglucosamine transferase
VREKGEQGEAKTFLLAGGGTAGHVNPLLATAAELQSRGHRVVAMGTADGLEATLVPDAGIELRVIPRAPAPRRPNGDAVRFPGRILGALRAAAAIVEDVKPDAVVGFGGYVSTPVYRVAHRRGIPLVVHEANARPGLANRLGARWAAGVAVTFPGTNLPRAVVTGLPLRKDIATLASLIRTGQAEIPRARARRLLGWPDDAKAALIMGGSLGAARLNAATEGVIASIVGHGIHVVHLTGKGKAEESERLRGKLPVKFRKCYVVKEYETDMPSVFAAVDAVVCRAGAGTVAEVSALGLPALYVPLPFGNGEQALNAAPAVAAGAATIIDDAHFTPAALLLGLEGMLLDEAKRREMERAAHDIGIVDGAENLADMVEGVTT